MLSIHQYVVDRVAGDESGGEMPEWVIWVAVLAVVGAALVPIVQDGLTTAYQTVMARLPGVGGS